MFWQEESEIPLVLLETEGTRKAGIKLYLKREDQLHPLVSGNKWRKLKYNFEAAIAQGKKQIVTFGGAYSNHLLATAAAGKLTSLATTGIVRGEIIEPLNPTLRAAQEKGMQLYPVSRSAYRDPAALIDSLPEIFQGSYILPEGGTNEQALKGCREIIDHCPIAEEIDYWCVSCGTGGTLVGMLLGLKEGQRAIGFSALKGDFLAKEMEKLLKDRLVSPWEIRTDYHFGGYAKFTPALIDFINTFRKDWGIPLDPIYTGKMLYGVLDLVEKGYFPRGTTLMAIHTGGLQGIAGFNERFGNLLAV